MQITPSLFLRRALMLDAIATLATGILLVAGTGLLQALLNLPASIMTYAGAFCVAWAGFVGILGTRAKLPAAAVWTVIVGNAAWTLGSLVLLVSGYVSPSLAGYAFVIAQAVIVGIFSDLQYIGMTKRAPAAA